MKMSLYDYNENPWQFLDDSPKETTIVENGDHQYNGDPAANQYVQPINPGQQPIPVQQPINPGQSQVFPAMGTTFSNLDLLNLSQPPPVTAQPPEDIFDTPSGVGGGHEYMSQQQQPMSTQHPLLPPAQVVVPHEEEQNHVTMSEAMNAIPQEAQLLLHQQQAVGLPVSNSQPPNSFQTTGHNILVFTPQLSQSSAMPVIPQQQAQAQKGIGAVDVPNLNDMEGDYGFWVSVEEKERTTKSPMWLMSNITKKLYTNINKAVPFEIRLKKKVPREQFQVRASAVFSSAQFLRTNVTRCPNHASLADVTNHDFPFPSHVVRADHPGAVYEESPSGRLSVVVPLDVQQDGSDYTPILLRFMCLGSCVGGINRRPIAIILTMETKTGQVYGRKVIDVRVCACPTRDIRSDEQTLLNKGVKRKGTSFTDKTQMVIKKKSKHVEPKAEPHDDDRILYIPVRGHKLYDFLVQMKEVYYKTHPEYAARYPDDTISFQMEDDSEDDLKGSASHRLGIADLETVNWDSGGDSPQRIVFSTEPQFDTSSGTKNSPLSKLTPNISISPSPMQLRLWGSDETEVIGIPKETLEYSSISKTKTNDIVITSSHSVNNSVTSDSHPSDSSIIHNQVNRTINFMPKHVPVMQVQSYKPGSLTVKTKQIPILRHALRKQNSGEKGSNKNMERRKVKDKDIELSPIDPSEISFAQSAMDDFMTPGSKEMLAANVLAEGFKAKNISKQ